MNRISRHNPAHELLRIKLQQAGLSYRDVCAALGCSKSLVSRFFSEGYEPPSLPHFCERVIALCNERGITMESAGEGKYWRDDERMKRDEERIQRQFLSRKCLKHFGMEFDSFYEKNEPYISKEFRVVAEDVIEKIDRVAFSAVIGQVGWGKSTLVQHLRERIAKELPHVVLAEVSVEEKRDIGTSAVRDAVLEALDAEEILGGRQRRSSGFWSMLANVREEGRVVCVIVDDAQWITPRMFAQLKIFSEKEHGYRRLLGILLVGQAPELTHRLNAIRAAGWRAHRIYLHGLAAESKNYIEQRLRVAGAAPSQVITPPALARLCELMTERHLDYALPLSALMSWMCTRAYERGLRAVPREMVEEFFTPVDARYAPTRVESRDKSLSATLGGGENNARQIA